MKKTLVSAFGFIILMVTAVAWAAPVPDTGQSKCYNNTVEITCPSPGQPFYGQDANYSINPPFHTSIYQTFSSPRISVLLLDYQVFCVEKNISP